MPAALFVVTGSREAAEAGTPMASIAASGFVAAGVDDGVAGASAKHEQERTTPRDDLEAKAVIAGPFLPPYLGHPGPAVLVDCGSG